ncbi:MAG: 7-cyano-7-deazaguanine synthase QueC [Nitrosomonadales bacterium]|nr:7-cyano-7-deazaguanine synthase QueC [Nitrosomonadales bacterium]MBT4182794.1 7-cyano-7-deazaguanine synthase QueC [Nitrosomonadales bacterium]MBT5150097.1 7-cyano-7-deazaguanine synthase QueC [Nitrosomonadales bacterium]MBT5573025.1 7-cyano-7-deazaguanine synthase QueC [Nitrosomonadales bacterium]MBT6014990.1 7-cyano-7-deazaguanine synthase QueC [Nitrosomonadales bacterium]
MSKKAIILLSGGLDSATTLAIAKKENYDCYALSVNYHQRHNYELIAAKNIAKYFSVKDLKEVEIDLSWLNNSALTNKSLNIPETISTGIPVTYVPARNTIMMSLAMAWAESIDCTDIFIGVNAVDYSGYPDCRQEYINSFQKMANLATKKAVEGDLVKIHTPLINLSKEEIIQTGVGLGVDYSLTISCYQVSSEGLACGKCDSCRLRKAGFEKAGLIDPTRYL